MNFTRTPNRILDQLPDMKKNELKLTMLLVRLTFGYMENGRHLEEVRLTFKDMMSEMKVAKQTVNNAVQAVEKRGFFRRGRRSTWHLNQQYSLNTVQKLDQNGLKSEPNEGPAPKETVQKLDQNGLKSEPNKVDNSSETRPFQLNKEKKKEEKEDNPFPFKPSPKQDLPEHKGPADKRLDAILEVCGFDASIDRHVQKAASAASQLRNYSPEMIYGRYRLAETPPDEWYWYRDDWRGQKPQRPTPDAILETISLDRVPESAVPGSRASPAPVVKLLEEVEAGSGLY